MLKLKLDFEVTLPAISDTFDQGVGTSHILPFKDGRAIAFGWGSKSGQTLAFPHGYWLAELTRDGATTRVLPETLTHGGEGLLVPPQSGVFLQAFLLGERFGILLTPEALLLFDGIHAEPQRIAISGPLLGPGAAGPQQPRGRQPLPGRALRLRRRPSHPRRARLAHRPRRRPASRAAGDRWRGQQRPLAAHPHRRQPRARWPEPTTPASMPRLARLPPCRRSTSKAQHPWSTTAPGTARTISSTPPATARTTTASACRSAC